MFYTQDKIKVRQYSVCAGTKLSDLNKIELSKILNACKDLALLAYRAPNSNLKKDWFGDCDLIKSDKINQQFNKIHLFLNGLDQFNFVSANDDKNSIASFPQKPEHKIEGGMVLGNLQAKYKKSAFIRIGPRYFDAKRSYKDKVLAVMHELTHMTLGTDDIKVGNIEMYDETNCKDLANSSPNLAYKNADNWALYSLGYWDLLGRH